MYLHYTSLYYFWLSWLSVFVSIKSNLFDVKSDDFCFVDINVEALKQNGILLSQFAQNIVEARF